MQPDTTSPASPGGALGRYQLLAKLASGGMGVVHVARSRGEHGFSRIVALKQLHEHLAEDAEVVARFLAEARIASQIVHPHVVSVLDVGSTEGRAFLVLDYVHGDSLAELLRAANELGEKPPLPVVAAILVDALEGLHAAHETTDPNGAPLGLVHRDVSPHNILVSTRGAAYVTDFGVAKVKDALRQTRSGSIVGKAGYMAPEQLGVGPRVTRATDIYGAGIVLWEALTGERLYEGLEQQIEAAVQRKTVPPPSSRRADVPRALDDLVLAMVALDPSARPRTALDAARTLATVVPKASAREVGEWVLDLAGPKLDRLDAAIRETPLVPAAHASGVREAELPPDLAPTIAQPMSFPDVQGTATRWRRRAQLSMTAAVSAVLLAVVASGTALWAASRRPAASAAPPASVEASGSAAAPDAPLPSAEPAAPVAEAVDASAPLAAASRPKPTTRTVVAKPQGRASTSAACTPPYVVEGGIKRYKRECFGATGGR